MPKMARLAAYLLLLWVLAGAGPALAAAEKPRAAALSAAENYVLQQVAIGGVADLKEKFGAAAPPRQLRAAFLEGLLTGGLPGFKAHRTGIFLVNAVITGPLSLEFATLAYPVFLIGCDFQGPANFGGSEFAKSLTIKQATFRQAVNCYRLKVGVDASFADTVFSGPADFGGARIGGKFTLAGAKFADRDHEANFNGVAAGQTISLKGTVFQGAVDFTGTRVDGEFNAAEAQFLHPEKTANFNGLKVSQNASFLKAVFEGPVDLGGVDVGGEFFADGARFASARHRVSFNGLKVGPRASFDGTIFQGPVDFSMAAVGGLLLVNQARFNFPDRPANFFGLKVDQHAFFSDTFFQGGLSLVGAGLKNLMIAGSDAAPATCKEINLDGATVEYALIMGDLSLTALQASRLQVKGPAIFKQVSISGKADLRDSNFYSLKIINLSLPANPDQVWLEGLSYQNISAGEQPQDWRRLLALIDLSRFDAQNYYQLESYFQRRGEKERADTVYIDGKRRETMQKWWRPGNLATLVFWDFLAGYGKKPTRTLWVSLLIVLLGALVFDHRNFDPSFLGGWSWLLEGSRSKAGVVRFFLSLDEFLPGVDLGLAKLWQMNKISFPTLMYYHFHKIAGWILIPIGLAAVFTQFK
jgi:uncharacterized protein YjbI with pentapeptide repeats